MTMPREEQFEEEEEIDENDTSDLFRVTDEDVLGEGGEEGLADAVEVSEEDVMGEGGIEGVIDIPEEEDMSNLVEVSQADIFGNAEPVTRRPKPRRMLFRRTNKRYIPPETGMTGMRY